MIYFVEDDNSIRKLVLYSLTSAGLEAEGFPRPSEFWAAMERRLPQVVLLDIMLPEEDGISILKKLRADSRTRGIQVILLTAKGSEYDKVVGLDAGADDYVSKPFGMMELMARVRAALRRGGESSAPPPVYELGELMVDPGRHLVQVNGESVALTLKEFQLLCLLLEHRDAVFTRTSSSTPSGATISTGPAGRWTYTSEPFGRSWARRGATSRPSGASAIRSGGLMTKKISQTILSVGLAVVILSTALFCAALTGHFTERVFRELEAEAELAAQGVALGGIRYLEDLDAANRLTWIDSDGTVLYDSQANEDAMENHLAREEGPGGAGHRPRPLQPPVRHTCHQDPLCGGGTGGRDAAAPGQ